ncbi:hypothetical protein RD792_017461 [Penstemon davidsonii]|uniref:Protein kinase domain-containing protein n=1 Tax=Penstemon davidsonii TaxID=160366 RepID=A0ABR0CM83_9LAMI|nr:hypothetical protein RD792_017461 [Penstemon davidsonii]
MAQEQKQENHPKNPLTTINNHYPLDSNCYKILHEIGRGVSAIVYKAICLPMNSSIVAIKAIDLEKSRSDFDNVRREAKTMTLLSHPNILKAHCSFTAGTRLWVVMPFMSGGSLQSIMSSNFPDGLSEPCIATILKEILSALSYLHGQGHLHRDIKSGNILIDSNGHIKLADFGVSASIYEWNYFSCGQNSSSTSSSLMFTDVAGTPYWMAPEVIHSHTGYSFKADIWSFGITALELAYGRPPLSHLPPSKSLIMKITKRFRFSDHYDEKTGENKKKKFSKSFKDMVGSCLDQDPSRRPSAEKLLKHSFFKNCKGRDYLVKNVLLGLPSVEERFSEVKVNQSLIPSLNEEDDYFDCYLGENVKQRRISGWNFNEEGFELDPVFPSDFKEDQARVTKQVNFGGETIIHKRGNGDSSEGSNSSPRNVEGSNVQGGGNGGTVPASIGGVDKETMLKSFRFLKKSLDCQRQQVGQLIALICGEENAEMDREEHLMKMVEKLMMEVENERKKRYAVEMELEFFKLQFSNE